MYRKCKKKIKFLDAVLLVCLTFTVKQGLYNLQGEKKDGKHSVVVS